MRKRALKPSLPFNVEPGDLVLIGAPGVSQPADWFVATVLLVAGDEVATMHMPPSHSGVMRQFLPITHVRAVAAGDQYVALKRFRDEAHEAVTAEWRAVQAAEKALGDARAAAWAKLDEIGATARRVAAQERRP